jgi:hypothetical protein
MSLIIQGNRLGHMALHVGSGCVASADAQLTSLIQTAGKVDSAFIESVSTSETHWEMYRHVTEPQVLSLMMRAAPEEIARLSAQSIFGSIICRKTGSRESPWALEVVVVVDSATTSAIVEHLRTALLDEHLFYVFVIDFDGFPAERTESGRPTLREFKEGVPYLFASASFTLKVEASPQVRVQVEVGSAQQAHARDVRNARA